MGIPTPLINWRKNGHHIPPKVITISANGLGTLIIEDVALSDQGSYTCEAINSRESVMAQHDALVVIKRKN